MQAPSSTAESRRRTLFIIGVVLSIVLFALGIYLLTQRQKTAGYTLIGISIIADMVWNLARKKKVEPAQGEAGTSPPAE